MILAILKNKHQVAQTKPSRIEQSWKPTPKTLRDDWINSMYSHQLTKQMHSLTTPNIFCTSQWKTVTQSMISWTKTSAGNNYACADWLPTKEDITGLMDAFVLTACSTLVKLWPIRWFVKFQINNGLQLHYFSSEIIALSRILTRGFNSTEYEKGWQFEDW